MKRREQLEEIFKNVDEDERRLVDKLIDEAVFIEERMKELKQLPFIAIHPDNPSRQKTTPAAKLYKEFGASYANIIRILLNVLRKVETSEMNSLLEELARFE